MRPGRDVKGEIRDSRYRAGAPEIEVALQTRPVHQDRLDAVYTVHSRGRSGDGPSPLSFQLSLGDARETVWSLSGDWSIRLAPAGPWAGPNVAVVPGFPTRRISGQQSPGFRRLATWRTWVRRNREWRHTVPLHRTQSHGRDKRASRRIFDLPQRALNRTLGAGNRLQQRRRAHSRHTRRRHSRPSKSFGGALPSIWLHGWRRSTSLLETERARGHSRVPCTSRGPYRWLLSSTTPR